MVSPMIRGLISVYIDKYILYIVHFALSYSDERESAADGGPFGLLRKVPPPSGRAASCNRGWRESWQ